MLLLSAAALFILISAVALVLSQRERRA